MFDDGYFLSPGYLSYHLTVHAGVAGTGESAGAAWSDICGPPNPTFVICSMYGIFTYIWVILGLMLVNIPAPWFAYGFVIS